MGKKTLEELQEKQALPLNLKIMLTKDRIRAWVNAYGIDGVYVSFSGGKDSTVLLDICRKMYPEMKACFVDTGLEFPEVREFVGRFDNVDIIKPRMNFKQVISKYGYPFLSKEISDSIYGARKYLKQLQEENKLLSAPPEKISDEELANILNQRMLSKSGGQNQRLAIMLGWLTKDKKHPVDANVSEENKSNFSQERYKFMLYAPFDTSNKCCNIMKKNPFHDYGLKTKRQPITAQMAAESRWRTQKWLENGCNAFDSKQPISNPMAFWTEQDVLLYLKQNELEIASVYGDVIAEEERYQQMTIKDFIESGSLEMFDLDKPTLCTTGCSRTGCAFCMYGAHLDKRPNRLETMLEVTNPNIYDYMMRGGAFDKDGLWKPDHRGLGFWFPILWINYHSKIEYYAPNIEKYKSEYGDEKTKYYLEN